MNYVYDIVLNFQDKYYEFFEWQKKDKIVNIKKIPIIRIDDKNYLLIKYGKIKIKKELLKKISNLSSIYMENNNDYKYICLFSNLREVIGTLFDGEGNLIGVSSLLFDEEEEAIEVSEHQGILNSFVEEKLDNGVNNFDGRIEFSKREKVLYFINNLYNDSKLDILKYIYYDYYEEDINDMDIIKNRLLDNMDNNKINKIYEIMNLITKKI